ncbi:LOW QUALITY PROTEIN: uncharacterized protein LOC144508740 [Mustelus asterias]
MGIPIDSGGTGDRKQDMQDRKQRATSRWQDTRDWKAGASLGMLKMMQEKEQYELYCDIGSTFQLCKICTERDKDVKIEPCGHLMCNTCLIAWQESDGHSCPFCRCEIKGMETIVVDPFQPRHQQRQIREEPLASNQVPEEEEEEEDNFEDMTQLMNKLAALNKASQPASPMPAASLNPGPPAVPPRLDLLQARSNTSPSLGSPGPVAKPRTMAPPVLPERPLSAALLDWMKSRPLPVLPATAPQSAGTARGPAPPIPDRAANQRPRDGELTAMDIILNRKGAERRQTGSATANGIMVESKYLALATPASANPSGASAQIYPRTPFIFEAWSSSEEEEEEDEDEELDDGVTLPTARSWTPSASLAVTHLPPSGWAPWVTRSEQLGQESTAPTQRPRTPAACQPGPLAQTASDPQAAVTLVREGYLPQDVHRALGIARNDLEIARTILQEFISNSNLTNQS